MLYLDAVESKPMIIMIELQEGSYTPILKEIFYVPADFELDLWSSMIPTLGIVNILGMPVIIGHTLEEKDKKNRLFCFAIGE